MSLTDTGVFRWRRWLKPALAAAATTPETVEEAPVSGHVYGSSNREPGDTTTALGRHRVKQTEPDTAPPARRDISLEQATQVIPLLDRVVRDLGLGTQEAVIYERLAANWRALPGEEGPATDHTADAVRLPALDQEGGESRD